MAKAEKFRTRWMSVKGAIYEARIMVEGWAGAVTEVNAAADPATLEWSDTEKVDTVQGSALTLRLISATDRQFVSLYTIKHGDILVDLYRNGSLYWSGTLDPEQYEEPYATRDGYEVTLTFSDFGILDRLKWSGEGFKTVRAIIEQCISALGITYNGINYNYALRRSASTALSLTAITIPSANFFDEDGEAMTLRDVLEETLKPFGFRCMQRGGVVRIYDLEWLRQQAASQITWASTDQSLTVDKVYNDVVVTFSPYAKSGIADGTLETADVLKNPPNGHAYYTHMDELDYLKGDGMALYWGTQAFGNIEVANGYSVGRFEKRENGEDSAFVCEAFRTYTYRESTEVSGYWRIESQTKYGEVVSPKTSSGYASSMVCKISGGPILKPSDYEMGNYKLRVSLDLLADWRYNPFDEEDGVQNMYDKANFAYIPCRLILRNSNGTALYHYTNKATMESNGYENLGSWASGAGSWGDMWLAYYDPDNRKSASGLGHKFNQNRPCIGYFREGLPELNTKEHGELIAMPPAAGWLELQIGKGLYQFDYGREEKSEVLEHMTWLLLRNPKIEITDRYYGDIDSEDIEIKAWINPDAKDELTIDTMVGSTAKETMPTARGLLYDTNYKPVESFYKSGHTGTLEQLLIGSVYSQHAERTTVLRGTAALVAAHCPLTDRATEGKFALLSESQDLRYDEASITAAEIKEETYEGIRYE